MKSTTNSRLWQCHMAQQRVHSTRCYFFYASSRGVGTIWAKGEAEAMEEARQRWPNADLSFKIVDGAR